MVVNPKLSSYRISNIAITLKLLKLKLYFIVIFDNVFIFPTINRSNIVLVNYLNIQKYLSPSFLHNRNIITCLFSVLIV